LDSKSLEISNPPSNNLPEWTLLKNHQCPNCPLDSSITYCPLAVNLLSITESFEPYVSFDNVSMKVVTNERTVLKETTLQRAISSLMGLIVAVSGCPNSQFFRPMANFHLPFSSEEETIYRATSMYLLAQYFVSKSGPAMDCSFKGLTDIYKEMQIVNASIAKRLRDASKTDSGVNALVSLDLYAKAMPFVIDEKLEELEYMFATYLKASEK